MSFKPKQSPLYPALLCKNFFRAIKLAKKITAGFVGLEFLALCYDFFTSSKLFSKKLFSFFTALFIISFVLDRFYETKLKNAKPKRTLAWALANKRKANLASYFNLEALNCLVSKQENPRKLLLCLIKKSKEARFVLNRLLIQPSKLGKSLRKKKGTERAKFSEIIIKAIAKAEERSSDLARPGDLLFMLAQRNPAFKKTMMDSNLRPEDIANLTWWYEKMEKSKEENKKWWSYENLSRKGSIGRLWASGYTVTLDKFSVDLTQLGSKIETIGREKEIEKIERELASPDTNKILMVGESGSGCSTIIHHIASRIGSGKSRKELNYKRMVRLNLARLLAETKNEEEAYFLLEKIFKEIIYAKNIILVIEDLHNFVTSQEKGGIFDLTGTLSKYLESPYFRLLAVTTPASYRQKVESKAGLLSFLERINVEELGKKETTLILERKVPFYEQKYNLFTPYQTLRQIVTHSEKYISEFVFPKKALHLLEDTVMYVQDLEEEKIVLPKHVDKILEEKTNIPVGALKKREKEILLNLEDLIHERIINQDEAVREVSEALRRARSGVATKKGPIGSFLFMGPTGVGKTETAKVLAKIYFGARENMIRLDMSEYQSREDIKRIVGTKDEQGILAGAVRKKPFSLVLLDEIEKAHPDLLHLFLQVLDEGYFTDGVGRRINFNNSIIIATSNAGYRIILKALKEKISHAEIRAKILNFVFDKGIFRPELVNRFDAVVVFNALTKKNLLDIAGLMLGKVQEKMEEKYIHFKVTRELKKKIVELSYKPEFGAREMQRVIQDTVQDALAEALLREEIEKGDTIKVTPQFKVVKS